MFGFGKEKRYYETVDTTIGRNIGGFIRGAAIGYAATELLKTAVQAKKVNDMQKAINQIQLDEYREMLDDILIKPNTRITGECAKYMDSTTYEERVRDLTDPTSPGYADHGKIINDMFDY